MNYHPDLGFRHATEEDWPAVYAIFNAVTATADTYPYSPDMTETEARNTWMASANTVFVAEIDGEIVGTAYLKPNIPGLGDHIANAGWMIDPARQGQGTGRQFAVYVIDQARDLGYHGMQFNAVVASNENAIALWQKLGFEIVGTVPDGFRHATRGLTPMHVMYREL